MTFQHGALPRFVLLYAGLFSAFGLVSPFLPAFLASRGLPPEDLGLVLGAGTAVRLVFGPFAGRLADRFHAFRAELAMSAILAAMAALSYFAVGAVWMVVVVSLFQAAALAPLVPLADALSLAHARRAQDGIRMGARRGLCDVRPRHAAGRPGRGYLWALHGDLAGRGLPARGLDGHNPGARVPRGSAT